MKTASATKVASRFQDYLITSQAEPVVVTRNGKPIAVLIAVETKKDVEAIVERRRPLQSIFREAHEQLKQGEGIPHDEFWRQVTQDRAVARPAKKRRVNRPDR